MRTENCTNETWRKQEKLLQELREWGSVVVAFSGGVDSSYLAWAAKEALGERALAVTACAPSFPERERREACRIAKEIGISREEFVFDAFQIPG